MRVNWQVPACHKEFGCSSRVITDGAFAGQVGCPLSWAIVDVVTLSGHTGSPQEVLCRWDMAHPWTIITWKVSKDCCLGKTGASVAPLTFLAITHKPIKAQFSTYWPFFHNVLSNSQVSLLTCGLSPFAGHHPTLWAPVYTDTDVCTRPARPRVGFTLSVLICTHCSYGNGTVVSYPVKK